MPLTPEEAAALGLPAAQAAPAPRRLSNEEAAALGLPGAAPAASKGASLARGAGQGITLGFLDEAAGGLAAALPFLDPEAAQGKTLGERYRAARDFYRAKNRAAEAANPGTYLAGQIAGATVPAFVSPATTARQLLVRSAGQGALEGAGYSDASSGQGLASDIALGGALGVAGHGAGTVLGKALSRLRAVGANSARAARSRAGNLAASEVADEIASARGALGGEVQKGSRQVENLMRLESEMTPAQLAQLAAQQAERSQIAQSVAQSTLDQFPAQAATIAGKKATLQALTQGAPQAVAQRTQALLTPQVGADTRSFLKSYAEPVVASYLGYKAADLAGADPETKAGAAAAAGLIFGRTRAGKALKARLTRPGHQLAIGNALRKVARKGNKALRPVLAQGIPAALIAEQVEEED